MRQRLWERVPGIALVLCALLAATSAARKSVTVDEFQALPSGLAILQTGDFRFPMGTPPLSQILPALALLPGPAVLHREELARIPNAWRLGRVFLAENAGRYQALFMLGRVVSILLLLATCGFAFGLARDLYGRGAAALTMVFCALCPNLLAHGPLVTPDIYLCAGMIGFLWAADRFIRSPGAVSAAAVGAAIAFASLSKFTGLLLFALFPISLAAVRAATWKDARGLARRDAGYGLAALALAVVLINCGYLFSGSLQPLASHPFHSPLFRALQGALPGLPVPFPFHFVQGLDDQLSETGYVSYLLGEFRSGGFLSYYLVAFLVKTPVPMLLMAVLAGFYRWKIRPRELPLLLLGIGCFAVFSIAGHKNIGIRYLLFLYPVAAIWIGRILAPGEDAPGFLRRLRAPAVAVSGAWLLVTALAIWPDYLAYFNRASGGPDRGHRYLLDSNLDWGQDLIALRDFADRHHLGVLDLACFGRVPPETYGIEYTTLGAVPSQRYVAISANLLWGRMYFVNGSDLWPRDPGIFARYRSLQPMAILGHSIYVFDLGKPR